MPQWAGLALNMGITVGLDTLKTQTPGNLMDLNGLLATSLETSREEDVMMKSRKEEED